MGKIVYNGREYLSAGTASAMQGATSTTDGVSGLVPQPLIADREKFLKGDGTWGTAGTEVEANPSETATNTLQKVDINGVIYDIQGGGGGGSNLIVDAQIYSTDEKQVGVWTDGKPVYQRVYELSSVVHIQSGAWTTVNIDTQDVGLIIGKRFINTSDGANTGGGSILLNSNGSLAVGNEQKVDTMDFDRIILWYTKTTDAAGSGGYQAWGFSPIIYSEEEREVGVWKDNKPLYAKTIQTTLTSTNHSIDLSVLNIDTFVDAQGCLRYQSGNDDQTTDYPYYSGSNYWSGGYFHKGRNIYYVQSSNDSVTYYNIAIITFYYTKTTDVAGSGSYNTLGVPNVHYSTDEQVIGTWVDNKPLYQKTTYFGAISSGANYALIMDIGANIVDTVIDMFANAKVPSGAWVVLPYPLPNADYAAYLDGYNKSTDKLTIKTGRDRSFVEGYITIQYTKIID